MVFRNDALLRLILASAMSVFVVSALPADVAAQTGQRGGGGQGTMMVDEVAIADDWGSRIRPNFQQYSQSLLREFNRLRPEDLARSNGGRAEIVSAIQDRYSLSNERASDRLAAWQMRQR